eukprot:6698008-Alexandrium_andersonii.AAC.1
MSAGFRSPGQLEKLKVTCAHPLLDPRLRHGQMPHAANPGTPSDADVRAAVAAHLQPRHQAE